MRYQPAPSDLYVNNRKRFFKEMKPNSVALFTSNDIMPTNADGAMGFKQNSDLFWLSGIDQEETILLLAPNSPVEKYKEVLFLKETNEEIAIWEGAKFTKEEAKRLSGIQTVVWNQDFYTVLKEIVFEAANIYLNSNEHLRASSPVLTRELAFIGEIKEKYPLHNFERAAPICHRLRSKKSPEEIVQMQKAIDITEGAFRRILKFVKPGVNEYEIEAELYHELLRNGSRGPAYDPIIASGFNACVLHYIANDQEVKDGDLLLMDIGAEYGNYAADLTRCIPVNGKFSDRQKEIYNAVLRVMKESIQLLVPGNNWIDYHEEVGRIMEKELIQLKLLDAKDVENQSPELPLYKKYFPHGTSHFLGIDVHDVGIKYEPFEPGMVFTCEPGIYIREESLGVRIENDILLTEEGNDDLMKNIPAEIEEIEDLMASN